MTAHHDPAVARLIEQARAEGAAEVVARVHDVLGSWQMSESRYHTIRAIDADIRVALRAVLRGDA